MHVSRAFPAALQDIITTYHYLLSLGFKRVAIIGDSSGGGNHNLFSFLKTFLIELTWSLS
jgi:acetyl esterase/lipase